MALQPLARGGLGISGQIIRALAGVVIGASALAAPLDGQERLMRVYAHERGLVAPPVWAVAQDSTGFLWVGTQAGLFRYDGNHFRRWAPAEIATAVISIAIGPRGRVAAIDERGGVFDVGGNGARRLEPPPGTITRAQYLLAFDADGRLWTVRDGSAWYRDAEAWQRLPRDALGGETVVQVREHGTGTVYVITDGGVWQAESGGARKLVALREVVDLWSRPDGALLVLAFDSRLYEVRNGRARMLASWRTLGIEPPHPRGIALVERRGTLWIALDRYLVALRSDGTSAVLGSDEDIWSGGPLLADHEGSLWVGTFSGLSQFPEPETLLWNDEHGLPSRHSRFVARSGSTVWISTWQGAGYLRRESTGWRAHLAPGTWGTPLCATHDGVLWTTGPRGFLGIRDRNIVAVHAVTPHSVIYGCGRAAGGGAWLATSRGLWYGRDPQATPQRVAGVPNLAGDSLIEVVHEDASGRLWIGSEGEICSAPVSGVEMPPKRWRCERLGDTGKITSIIEPMPGTMWLSTMRQGVLAREGDEWRAFSGNDRLATRAVFRLAHARDGGIWILGHGILERAVQDTSGRWMLVEGPRAWHGLATVGGEDLLEDADGTLWIATALGVVQVPSVVRDVGRVPPAVALVDARVDEASVALVEGLELPHHRNRLTLEFAALSYRDRSVLRYQLRLTPGGEWTEVREPSFRWVDLSPGRYLAEVRASLDGIRWTPEPARFQFSVLRPWYSTPGALVSFALALLAVLWAAYRLRLAYLLGLERQRTRIAMDLHDEVGSGLGSIGILSGVLAASGPEPEQGRRLATEIARATEELGTSLDDIIWSLDPRVTTLDELSNRLVEHGSRLFADGDVEFRVEQPVPLLPHPLPLTVRRTVLLIGLEALHNAAKHASAHTVVLRLTPSAGGWELCVRDDGVGLPSEARADDPGTAVAASPRRRGRARSGSEPRSGRGLDGMRRRAAEIGATLQVWSSPDAGTSVTLRFATRGARWRWLVPRRRRRVT